jgi:hypothetical protein
MVRLHHRSPIPVERGYFLVQIIFNLPSLHVEEGGRRVPCGKEGGYFLVQMISTCLHYTKRRGGGGCRVGRRGGYFLVQMPSLHIEEGGEGRHPVEGTGYLGAPSAVFSSSLVGRLFPARVLAVAGVQATRNPPHPSCNRSNRGSGITDPVRISVADPDPHPDQDP